MIQINLLGKKKKAGGSALGSFEEIFQKVGISSDQVTEFLPALLKVGVIVVGLYVGNYIPVYQFEKKKAELNQSLDQASAHVAELQKELAARKDLRKQMDQLNNEEAELQRQLKAVTALKQNRSQAFKTFYDIVSQLDRVKNVWMENFSYSAKKVLFDGRSWDYLSVYDFVRAINESTRYMNVLFKEVTAEPPIPVPGVPESQTRTKKFSLEFNVKDEE